MNGVNGPKEMTVTSERAMNLAAIQSALREAQVDGWLFYDHHHRDPIAYRILNIAPVMCTRRWYYHIPAAGEPAKLAHRIESTNLTSLPGTQHLYAGWAEQREKLQRILEGKKRIAMEYSPLNDIPYVGLVDAGTVELVRSFGIDVVSSADLVQLFEARWSPGALASHLEAGNGVHAAIRGAFNMIRDIVAAGKETDEYSIQQAILHSLGRHRLITEEPPIVAANANSGNPHYSPTPDSTFPIRRNDLVLLDVWAKLPTPGAVYFDVTWTGYVGEAVPHRCSEVFDIVREARDAAINLVKSSMQKGRTLRGCDVDDRARAIIKRHGYADYFVHRTGHSIGEDIHGNGANMDNFETRDVRAIIPATCFSVEPGIYLREFGIRSEVNVYVEERDARVTGEIQQSIITIMREEPTNVAK
jgi:Xaa-Pro aminopeptidase